MSENKNFVHFNEKGEMIAIIQAKDPIAGAKFAVELTDNLSGAVYYKYDVESKKVIGFSNEEMEEKHKEIEKENHKKFLKDKTLHEIVDKYPLYKQINFILDQIVELSRKNKVELTADLSNFVKFRNEKIEELNKNISAIN